MSRISPADKRTLQTVANHGGVTPPADIPGGRKLYDANLKLLRRLEAKGWLALDDDYGDNFFVITQAGAEAAGIDFDEEG